MIYFIISLSTFICYLIIKNNNDIQLFYKRKKRFNFKERLLTPELLIFPLIFIFYMVDIKIMEIIIIIFYAFLFLFEIKNRGIQKSKKMHIGLYVYISLIYLLVIMLCILDYALVYQNDIKNNIITFDYTYLYYTIIMILGYLSYPLLSIGLLVNKKRRI